MDLSRPRCIVFQPNEWSMRMALDLLKDDPVFFANWGSWIEPPSIHGGDADQIKELFDMLEPEFKQRNLWIRLDHRL